MRSTGHIKGDVRLLHGLESKLISHDAVTGASTSMARLPASWSQTHGDEEATLELFVCEGDLSVEGAEVGAGGYAFVPRGAGCDLGSTGGAQALVFSNPRWRPLGGRRFT